MKKKLTAMVCLLGLSAAFLAGCGGSGAETSTEAASSASTASASVDKGPKATTTFSEMGQFNMETIDGKSFTADDLKGHKLTLVNLMGTFCNPCIAEMPDLEKLNQEMKDKGVQVVGIVVDTTDGGKDVPESVQKAKKIQKETGVTYPLCKPDETVLGNILKDVTTFPTSYLVDENGKVVGQGYAGARSLDQWKEIINSALEEVNK
ncbi:TlpA family protein disulfide reductase [Peptococcus simiae]|uniref:TlpA family protein disulfide reductase n=1 Tax=Peptococcus simiae TaxID=1643805 RepID=A0ABW9H1Y7_9FIRM